MIDPNKILALVDKDFVTTGQVTIDAQGLVSVSEDCYLKAQAVSKLPVQFDHVGREFFCFSRLTSLEGAPRSVGGDFFCQKNQLTTLKGSPDTVGGDFRCGENPLTSLDGIPQSVGGSFSCDYTESLGLLRLLLIKKVKSIWIQNPGVESIINRYLGKGRDGIIPCAAELHKAGYGGNAKL